MSLFAKLCSLNTEHILVLDPMHFQNPTFGGKPHRGLVVQAFPRQVRFQLWSRQEQDVKDSVSTAWRWPNLAGWGVAWMQPRVRFDFNRKAGSFKFMQQGSRPKRISRWWCLLSALITPCHLWCEIKQMFLQIRRVSFIYPTSAGWKPKQPMHQECGWPRSF